MDQRSKRKTIKLFEENIGQKLRVIGLGNDFLDMIPKSRRNHMNKSLEERKNMQIGE